jgi:FlaA1/EpsC-like NDP-sugar epimerase
MGATKRISEMIIKGYAQTYGANMVSVRFGNVLGSRGSVIWVMKRQIERRHPITITDPDMLRYFMTIPEAAQLILQAGSIGGQGEIFVLDMGSPVRIMDLAHDLIRLSGLVPNRDIPIRIIGRRPGEKLQEELLTESEAAGVRKLGPFYMAQCLPIALPALLAQVAQLRVAAERGEDHQVVEALQRLVPTLGDGVGAAAHRGQARLS